MQTLKERIGGNVQRLRAGTPRDEIAADMLDLGFSWTASSIAGLETGAHEVTLEELVGLGIALEATAHELLGSGRVQLTSSTTIPLVDVLQWLAGDITPQTLADAARTPRRRELEAGARRERAARRAAEQDTARRLDVDVDHLVDVAFDLWGRGLTDERERRVKERAAGNASSRSLQAIRGHVTRELLDELQPALKKGARR